MAIAEIREGDRYRCPVPGCGCEIVVATAPEMMEPTQSFVECCGHEMERSKEVEKRDERKSGTTPTLAGLSSGSVARGWVGAFIAGPPVGPCLTCCKRNANERGRPRRHGAATERYAARTDPHGTAPDGTGRHEVAGLITQRSLVQIQPAQREKPQVGGLNGGSPGTREPPLLVSKLCLSCSRGLSRKPRFQIVSPSGRARRTSSWTHRP